MKISSIKGCEKKHRYIYIYKFVYIYIYTCVYIHIGICIYMFLYVNKYIYIYVYIYIYLCISKLANKKVTIYRLYRLSFSSDNPCDDWHGISNVQWRWL